MDCKYLYRKLRITFFIVLFFYLPLRSMAWGMLGHRIVGEIADAYLTPKARAEIKKILGSETIAMASNWADFIKSDSTYRYLNSWHYVDFNSALTYKQMQEALKHDTSTNAYTKLNFLIKELQSKNLQKNKKVMYLRLLIHIVGDVHQPLHVSAKGDLGGNTIKVTWFGKPTNLHSVWDQDLIQLQELSYTEYTNAINHTTLKQRKEWQKMPLTQWFYNSYTISNQLHNEIKQPEQKLSYSYNFKHLNTLNEQLLIGGVHLAGLLNQIFG